MNVEPLHEPRAFIPRTGDIQLTVRETFIPHIHAIYIQHISLGDCVNLLSCQNILF